MKFYYRPNLILVVLILTLLIVSPSTIAQQETPYQYVSPKPNSVMVSNETNIILRNANKLKESTINQNLITVSGSLSGLHTGDFLLTDDEQTIVFNPHQPFEYNEVVSVSVQNGIKTLTDSDVAGYSFSFNIETEGITQIYAGVLADELNSMQNITNNSGMGDVLLDTLPAPPITIDSLNNPGPGYIFMATWDRNIPQKYGNFIFILDNEGQIVDSLRVNGAAFDFKVQPNGLLSYGVGNYVGIFPTPGAEFKYIVMDSTFAVVDSFQMKNGYSTDFHEFLMLPNGHVMLMSFHTIIFDMSTIIPGGKTDCRLTIAVLQEQDSDGNVVFEWRDLDHIPITDSDEDLTSPTVLYTALNGFDLDDDGNILMSMRHLSEIIKINRATGELIWRMGSPRSEFTYVGEHEENAPYYHARQHHIQRLPNGNVTLFDNGEYHQPPYSRAVEYSLDEVNKVATLVSEWRYPNGNIFAALAGNAQWFPDGRWFICYGAVHPQFSQVIRQAVEVHSDGSIALELSLPPGVLAYRIYKMPWNELIKKPSVTHFEILEGFTYTFNDTVNAIYTDVTIYYVELTAYGYNEATITRLPFGPVQPEFNEDVTLVYPVSILYENIGIFSHTSEIRINLSKYPEIKHPEKTSFFIRVTPNQGMFTMMPTTYDSLSNQLIGTTSSFGEIVFGETDDIYSANIPILYEPINNKKVLPLDLLTLQWTGRGVYDLFQIQISTDSTFNTVEIDSIQNPSFFVFDNLMNHTTYFWRVRSILGVELSNWSPVWRFDVTDAFVEMVTPNGGEAWSMGSEYVIRWETNTTDSVRLDLLYGQQNILSIDTTFGDPSAFSWLIPANLTVDSSYKIIITSINDPLIKDTSDASFSIVPPSEVEILNSDVPEDYSISQNYPNPFNPSTEIEFTIPEAGLITLRVFDLLGKEITTLVNEQMQIGKYKVTFDASNLPSGVYFYTLQANDFVSTKKMVLLK